MFAIALGVVDVFVLGLLLGRAMRSPEAASNDDVVHAIGSDGAEHWRQFHGPQHWPAHQGPPLRPYVVRDDGVIEYSDGETSEPDKTKIKPPDMRLVS